MDALDLEPVAAAHTRLVKAIQGLAMTPSWPAAALSVTIRGIGSTSALSNENMMLNED